MIPFDFDFTLRGKGHFEKGGCRFCNCNFVFFNNCCWLTDALRCKINLWGNCRYRLLDYYDWW